MFIQAGVFADHENARRRVEVLLAAGIELASLDEIPAPRTLHRVRVGPFASVEEFDLTMNRLRELGIARRAPAHRLRASARLDAAFGVQSRP